LARFQAILQKVNLDDETGGQRKLNLGEYKVIFAIITAGLLLLSITPALSVYVSIPDNTNRFSQLWVLGPTHHMDLYPLLVNTSDQYQLFLGVSDQIHTSGYYMVNVKFRNETQSAPTTSNSTPSAMPTLYPYRVFLTNGGYWETNFTFSIANTTIVGEFMTVGDITINGVDFPVNSVVAWDSQNAGFYYQIFFELWQFNPTTNTFQYDNQSVWLWIKIAV
jgi:hypothetical protein